MKKSFLQKEQSKYLMGIAILGIVYYHFAYLSPDNSCILLKLIRFIFEQGFVGVNIFIFISAYGLCKSFENNKLNVFYYRRFIRIYPVFIIWSMTTPFLRGNSISCAFASLTGFSLFWDIDHYAWYLEASVIIYFCFPLLYYFSKNTLRYAYILTIALIGLAFYLSVNPICNNYQANIFLNLIPTILAGIYVHFFEKEDKNKALAYLGIIAVFSFMPNARHSFLMIPALCYVISRKVIPMICKIGEYSLEIYAAHSIMLTFIIDYTGNMYIDFLLFTIGTIVLSIILHIVAQLFERNKMIAKYSNRELSKPTS